jgi:hypothetical protein
VFLAVAAVALTVSAPDHGGSHTEAVWLLPILALVSAATPAAVFAARPSGSSRIASM